MGKPRFRLWKLMIFVPVAAILIAAGHDFLMMAHAKDDATDGDPGWILGLLLAAPCGSIALFVVVVFLASRGDQPPRT